jgi:predicted HTH domain antitoxin
MGTARIHFDVPEGILHSLNQSKAEFTAQVRLLTAVQFFASHKLTFGQAMKLAEMEREQFLTELAKRDIPVIDYVPDELEAELSRFSP